MYKLKTPLFYLLATTVFVNCHSSRSIITDTKKDKPGFTLSQVQTIKSTILNEDRKINIYLPENYSDSTKEKFSVIYLLDGGLEEDFIHVTGIVRYNSQPWVGRLAPSIVVGIENNNRKKDFTFSIPSLNFLDRMGFSEKQFPAYGGSASFISFIEKELQPFIEKNYNTNSSKTIIGESLGGLLATEILLKHSSLFNTYIIIAPSLWWGQESLLAAEPDLLQKTYRTKTNVYVSACNKEEDKIMYNDAVSLVELLKKHGGDSINVLYDYIPSETHATLSHQSIYNAFKLLSSPKN